MQPHPTPTSDPLPQRWTGDTLLVHEALRAAWGDANREEAVLRWLLDRSPSEWALVDVSARSWLRPSSAPPSSASTLSAGWLSFAADGHKREAAVARLADDPHPAAAGFLLVRCDDWVGPVRARAQDAVGRLAAAGRLDYARWTPLLLARTQRSRSTERLATLLDAAPPAVMSDLLRHPDRATRRWAVDRIGSQCLPAEALERLLQPIREPFVAAALAELLVASGADPVALLAAVRRVGWGHLADAPTPPLATPTLATGLLDASRAIQALAQRAAEARGVDAEALYLAAPTAQPAQRRRRLAGLDTLRAPAASALAQEALLDPDGSVRATAIEVLGHASPPPGQRLRGLLSTTYGVELRATVRALRANQIRVPEPQLAALRRGTLEQRRAAWDLGRASGRWHRLCASLLAASDPDPALARAASADVACWIEHVSVRAGKPPPELRAVVEQVLATTPEVVPGIEQLRFAIR